MIDEFVVRDQKNRPPNNHKESGKPVLIAMDLITSVSTLRSVKDLRKLQCCIPGTGPFGIVLKESCPVRTNCCNEAASAAAGQQTCFDCLLLLKCSSGLDCELVVGSVCLPA